MARAISVAIGALIVLVGIGALLLAFTARDDAGLDETATTGPGQVEPDRGSDHVTGQAEKLTDTPPTSGPHPDELPPREGAWTDGQILHALELGNVVIVHPGRAPEPPLRALQEQVTGPYDPALAEAGQMVIHVRRTNATEIQALAWRRRLATASAADPQLREFAEAWLGRGAGASGDDDG